MPRQRNASNGKFVPSAATAEQDLRAWGLRVRGLSYSAIAGELGLSGEGARQAVQRHAARLPRESTDEVEQLVYSLLDDSQRILTDIAVRPHYLTTQSGRLVTGPDGEYLTDPTPVIAAVGAMLRLIEQRAKLLGLYAPARKAVEVITHDAFVAVLKDWEAEIAELEAEAKRREQVARGLPLPPETPPAR